MLGELGRSQMLQHGCQGAWVTGLAHPATAGETEAVRDVDPEVARLGHGRGDVPGPRPLAPGSWPRAAMALKPLSVHL